MKKRRIAGLLVLLPLCALSACGGGGPTTLPISPNWYANTTTSRIDYSAERLEYAVTFTPPSVQGDYFVTYNDGVYTTELSTVNYTFGDGSSANVYCYKTELKISGHYTYQGTAGETFEDFVTSAVYFHTADKNLRPIMSTKEIRSTNPAAVPAADHLCDTVHLTYSVVYNTNASASETAVTAATVTSSLPDEGIEGDPAEIEIDADGSFFDNEEILFALRGLGMTAAVSFTTIDPQTNNVCDVIFTEAPAASTYSPTALALKDGDATTPVTGDLAAYTVHFHYDIAQSGPERTAYYAALTDTASNQYRNVLLRLEDPIPSAYGTLVYTLKTAEFAK